MSSQELLQWLLQGDVSIQYQVHRDLLKQDRTDLQKKITSEGWGAMLLANQKPDGHWGKSYYQPKWTSSHYTVLDLRNLCPEPNHKEIKQSIHKIATEEKGRDGGINPSGSIAQSDVCINGMFLNFASYFKTDIEKLKSIVDFILSQVMPDGGFNCRLNRSGATHSSLHSTISVLEGITEFVLNKYDYRLDELRHAEASAKEFILLHQLFISDHTGEIIHKDFLKFPYPDRWRYNILRALDYFRYSQTDYDGRMARALEIVTSKRNKHGTWNLGAHQPGQIHFVMEKAGQPSRWNTLRALRILDYFNITNE